LSASSAEPPWRRVGADGSITLEIHAQPGAKRSEVAGLHGDGTQMRLKVRLAAPPAEGRANAELRHFLADAFGVPLRNVTLARGETGRRKTVRIEAPARRPDRSWELLGRA
jgi:hypothetical protein